MNDTKTNSLQMVSQVVIDALVKQYGPLRALMGPSGSGKTTLINILGGLDALTSGSVVVDGVDLAKLNENAMVRYRAEKIGFVFQQFHLVPYLNAVENVMLAQYFHSVTDEGQAAEALKRVGLGHRLTHLPSQLSGGEQQSVGVARALINQPKLILADEPTGNLDEANEEIVLGLFRELHSAGHTILMVTHDPDIAQQADRRIELVHGHLAVDQRISMDDGIHFDHLLEQIWVCQEEGNRADVQHIRTPGGVDPVRALARMEDLRLVQVLEEHLIQLN